MKPLGFAPAALDDMRDIASFIAADNPDRASSFVAELIKISAKIAERPLSFPARDDLSRGLRAARHGRYLLLFRDLTDEVRIVRVAHGSRNLAVMFDD